MAPLSTFPRSLSRAESISIIPRIVRVVYRRAFPIWAIVVLVIVGLLVAIAAVWIAAWACSKPQGQRDPNSRYIFELMRRRRRTPPAPEDPAREPMREPARESIGKPVRDEVPAEVRHNAPVPAEAAGYYAPKAPSPTSAPARSSRYPEEGAVRRDIAGYYAPDGL